MALQKIDTRLTGASPYSANLHPSKSRPGSIVRFGRPAPKTRTNLAQGAAKLAFLAGITATVLLAWQGITLHFQQFSVRPDAVSPVATTVARWVHNWTAALKPLPASSPAAGSAFQAESEMGSRELLDRWNPIITEASLRFDIPARWIRAVVQMESGGRTMSSPSQPITSRAGAMGVMQLMPGTYKEMRAQYHLGANPYDPHDNIIAGAAYLHWLYTKYGYPTMFAAYNDGPGHLEDRLVRGGLLPAETRNYVSHIVTELGGSARTAGGGKQVADFTRPNGEPVKIDLARITSVRVPLAGEYAPNVHAVISSGDVHQAVRESYDAVKETVLESRALAAPARIALRAREAHHVTHLAAASRKAHSRDAHYRLAKGKHGRVVSDNRLADSTSLRIHPLSHHRQS